MTFAAISLFCSPLSIPHGCQNITSLWHFSLKNSFTDERAWKVFRFSTQSVFGLDDLFAQIEPIAPIFQSNLLNVRNSMKDINLCQLTGYFTDTDTN